MGTKVPTRLGVLVRAGERTLASDVQALVDAAITVGETCFSKELHLDRDRASWNPADG